MEWQFVFIIAFGSLFLLLMSGAPVAVAFVIFDVIAVCILWGLGVGPSHLFLTMIDSISGWMLMPVIFFILLGEVLFHSGIANRAIDVVDMWLGRFPGRLGLVAVGSGILISTLSGSTVASASVLSSTLVFEMERRGYKKSMSLGPVIGSGGLAMMIPPSGAIILVAYLASFSIAKLLMACIIPGLLMGTLYAVYIIVRCYLQPSIAPPYDVAGAPMAKKLQTTGLGLVPVAVIIFLVTGLILLGITTPTEAAAAGALGAFVLAAAYGRLSLKMTKACFVATTRITVMLLAILLGATGFGQILAFTGCSKGLVEWIAGSPVSPIAILIFMQVFLLFLGCFMDEVAIMVMIIPIYMPIIYALGFNPLWFLVLLLISMEMGLTTPPFGLILFVMKGLAPPGTTMGDIYKAGLPFLACDATAVALIMVFPQIALWLPSVMR
jgi:tripartite ATP-independent transporter DctM subunit